VPRGGDGGGREGTLAAGEDESKEERKEEKNGVWNERCRRTLNREENRERDLSIFRKDGGQQFGDRNLLIEERNIGIS